MARTERVRAAVLLCAIALLICPALPACDSGKGESEAVKGSVKRYNELLIEGYKKQNMNLIREVAEEDQALKLYHHMAAIGEGKLRLDSTLKDLQFVKIDFPKAGEALVETKEIWDFTHVRIATGEKFAEEKDFIYIMGYTLHKREGKWVITDVNTISGTSTNTTLPWPEVDRKGNIRGPGGDKSASQP